MTKFEQFLLNKGYVKHKFNTKTMKIELSNENDISCMGNIDFRYYHVDDVNKENAIIFGLHEKDKPVTLISPRPRLKVTRIIDNEKVIQNEIFDDSMNVAFSMIPNDLILIAMFNKNILLEIDLT
jgi:dynactin complex subunit